MKLKIAKFKRQTYFNNCPANESDNLEELCNQIIYFVKKLYNYEIIIVEMCSDNSFELLKKINKENHRIKYIKLTRNFGYYGGLIAGMENLRVIYNYNGCRSSASAKINS